MAYLFLMFLVLLGLWLSHRRLRVLVWMSSLLCAVVVTGCGAEMAATPPPEPVPQVQVVDVCWNPPEVAASKTPSKYFIFPSEDGVAVGTNGALGNGFVFRYDVNAPVKNLKLLPLSRPEAWCTRIPRPTDPKILRLLDPCSQSTSMQGGQVARKNLLGDTQVSVRSPGFCGQYPRMAPTTQDTISLRQRNDAFQEAFVHSYKTAAALTQANADIEWVTNKSNWSLKRFLIEDPGSLEQIQQRIANTLNSIEAPPEYDDPILESIALAGFRAGFDEGKFAVEAKLFAIDVGIFVVELALTEIALGPLGGAKLLTSAVSKGTKVMKAAFVRLGDIPIFIPGAANGFGGFIRARNVVRALSKYHSNKLEKAMFAEAKELEKTLIKLETDETHHIVPHGSNRPDAQECRKILDKFDIDIDHPANGVFLPANKSSPNPNGAIVHKILGSSDDYYRKMLNFLKQSTSQADAIQRLRRVGEALKKGTFFNAPL